MRREGLLVLVLVMALAGCGSPAPSSTPSAPTATEVAQAGAAPTPPAIPTTVAEQVAASTAAAPTQVPSAAGGVAHFRDKLATADQLTLQLEGLPAPAADQVYLGWLLGDGDAAVNIGPLNVNPDGSAALEWNSPDGGNLLSRYARLQITLEPGAGGAAPTGPVVLDGGLQDEALTTARRLFVKNDGEPATPRDVAFALGLVGESRIAIAHVQNAVNAAAIGALPETRMHLEHVVNIIEGAAGPRYGDHDGNGTAENPGDGFGMLGYATQVAELLQDHQPVVDAAADVQAQGAIIQDRSLEILKLDDPAVVTAQLAELKQLADRMGAEPVARLYQAAQDAVGFPVVAAP